MSGANAEDPEGFAALCRELGVQQSTLSQFKDPLRRNTDEAVARGVFGVPSFVVNGEVFWGADAIDFVKAFIADPAVIQNDEMRRVDHLPAAASRKA
jgi:2-hydroxychromene-2-carboxylate isomerase